MIEPVHWHEGLFLQPHHLQVMQKQLMDQFAVERRIAWPFPYGMIDYRLSSDELENKWIRFERLTAIMPSGLELSVPGNTDLNALNIQEAFDAGSGTLTVCLAVPLWYDSRANAIEPDTPHDQGIKRRYRVHPVEKADENTGDQPQTIPIRHINARLLLPGDDQSDMEIMPVLRITRDAADEEGLPREDPQFAPPCLVLDASPVLRRIVTDLVHQIEVARTSLIEQLTRGGFSIERMRGVQFEQMLRLRSVNRYTARLQHLVRTPTLSPSDVYAELRGLHAELAALHPDRDPFATADYDHEAPATCFLELSGKIRALLHGEVTGKILSIPFELDPAGKVLIAQLSDEHLTTPNAYYLGIKTSEDPRALAALVEDINKFKLMPLKLANQRVWGVKLKEERHPPVEMPSEPGLNYFALLRGESADKWDRVKQEKALAIRWPDMESADYKITLYMTIPEAGE